MLLDKFLLEVLVKNVPLPEYCEVPAQDALTQTRRSFVYNPKTEKNVESPVVNFIGVKKPSTRFALRYAVSDASEQNPYIVHVYIDGQSDNVTYVATNNNPFVQEGLYNEGRDKIHLFSFDASLWSEKDADRASTSSHSAFGGPGIITAVFYMCKKLKNPVVVPIVRDRDGITQKPLQETKEHHELELSVGYDGVKVGKTRLVKSYRCGKLVGVVNLHYRAESVLRAKGHPIPLEPDPPRTVTSEISIKKSKAKRPSGDVERVDNSDSKISPSSTKPQTKIKKRQDSTVKKIGASDSNEAGPSFASPQKRVKVNPRDDVVKHEAKIQTAVVNDANEKVVDLG